MPPFDLLQALAKEVFLPALGASAGLMGLAVWRLDHKWWPAAAAIAIAAAMIASNAVRGALEWTPESGWRSLLAAALVALAVGMLRAGVGASIGALAPLAYALLPDDLRTPLWLAGTMSIVFACVVVLDRVAEKQPQWSLALGWLIVINGAAVVAIAAGSARFSDAALYAFAALLGVSVFTLWRSISLAALAPLLAIYIPGLMISGHYDNYTDVSLVSFALVALAPLCLAPLLLPQAERWPNWVRHLLAVLLPAAPVIVAVTLALIAAPLW
jgi:hypothetical protein